MRLLLFLFIAFMATAYLLPGWFAYGHDCPLWQMGRLETFRDLDKDKDRRLSLEEFMAQEWCQDAPSCQCQEEARQFFHKLDQNQDGFITLEEHQAFAKEMQRLKK